MRSVQTTFGEDIWCSGGPTALPNFTSQAQTMDKRTQSRSLLQGGTGQWRGHGAGVARAVSHFWLGPGAGVARACPVPPRGHMALVRAWRGHGAGRGAGYRQLLAWVVRAWRGPVL
eukprot:gene16332-biopygen735